MEGSFQDNEVMDQGESHGKNEGNVTATIFEYFLMQHSLKNCPIDYDEMNCQNMNKNETQMMIPENRSMIS